MSGEDARQKALQATQRRVLCKAEELIPCSNLKIHGRLWREGLKLEPSEVWRIVGNSDRWDWLAKKRVWIKRKEKK